MYRVIVRLHHNASVLPEWRLLTPEGNQLDDFNETLLTDSDITVIVPGMDVYLSEMTLPLLSTSQIKKATPFILEEQLVEELRNCFIATDIHLQGSLISAAVISKSKMKEWHTRLDLFFHFKLPLIRQYVPDMLGIPVSPKAWTIFIEDEMLLVRTGTRTGFNIEKDEFWTLFELFLNTPGIVLPECLRLIGNLDFTDYQKQILQKSGITLIEEKGENYLRIAETTLQDGDTFDVLQGFWRFKISLSQLKRLHRAGLLILAILIAFSAGTILKYFILSHQLNSINQNNLAIFHQFFPDIKNADNRMIKKHFSEALLKINGNPQEKSFLNLLNDIADIPGDILGLTLISMRYEKNQLTLHLEAEGFEQIDRMKKALKSRNYIAKLYDVVKTDQSVNGKFIIQQ